MDLIIARRLTLTLSFAVLCIMSAATSMASELLESGPNYFVVQNDAGGTTGSVVMRMDISTDSRGYVIVTSRIVSISAMPGWTWTVRKPGGANKQVEVQFTNGVKGFTFKALYVPGKTVIDGGVIK